MMTSRISHHVLFVFAWTLAATISLFASGFIFHYPASFPSTWDTTSNIGGALFGFIIGAVSGLLLGLPQWMLLRRYIPKARRWLLTTVIGLGIMHSIGDAFPYGQFLLGATLLSALVMSVMQRHLLRDVLTQPNLWLIVSVVGWVGGYLLGMTLLRNSGLLLQAWTPQLGATQHGFYGVVQGAVYSIVTGIALVWFSHRVEVKTSVAVEPANS